MDYLQEEIYTPKPASTGSRFAAALIDFIGILALAAIIGYCTGEAYFDNENGFNITLHDGSALLFMLAWIIGFPVVEGLTGQTIGKRIIGIKVIRKNGNKGTVMQSIVRHLFDPIDYCLLIGLIIIAVSSSKQRIGDLVANTIVVKK